MFKKRKEEDRVLSVMVAKTKSFSTLLLNKVTGTCILQKKDLVSPINRTNVCLSKAKKRFITFYNL